MDRKVIDFWVGLFILLGFAALMFLALKVADAGSERVEKGYTVTARFENIGGLKVRAPVKASGVLVGRVDEIKFDPKNYQAIVVMHMYDRYPFPKDTSASILTSGLLGEVYVGLEAGGDSAMLKQGDQIKLAQSAVVLEKLIGQFLFQRAEGGGDKK